MYIYIYFQPAHLLDVEEFLVWFSPLFAPSGNDFTFLTPENNNDNNSYIVMIITHRLTPISITLLSSLIKSLPGIPCLQSQ